MPFDGEGQYFQGNGCCDPDSPSNVIGTFPCTFEEVETAGSSDEEVCDPDCPGYDATNCTTIPLDGGLGLLALAGGGLATAAMRRRREEEAEQQA